MTPCRTSRELLESSAEPRLPVQLLILESAERTDDCLSFRTEGAARTCIVARDPGERPVDLALRVIRRIAAIEASSAYVESVILAIDESRSNQAKAARSLVATAVVSHMLVAGGGRLVLLLSPSCEADTRHEAMDLAGSLLVDAANTGITIGLRFGVSEVNSGPRSGVYPIVTAMAPAS